MEFDRGAGVSELLEARLSFRAHPGKLEEHGDHGGIGGEEGVGRDPELRGDVERGDGRRVDDHGVDAPGRQGAEELAEALVVAPDDLDVPEERVPVVRDGGRVLDLGEPADGGATVDGGFQRGVLLGPG